MANQSRSGFAILVIAAFVLSACQPATGTLQATVATPAEPSTPLLIASEQPVSPVATASSVQATTVFKSKDPTTLTYYSGTGEPLTLDPIYIFEPRSGAIVQNMYDTLIFYNREHADQFVPQLATEVPSQANGGISADGRTYTFKIRTGVKFHNGDLLTPDDVAFTFQRGLLNGGLGSGQWLLFQPILGVAASPSGNNEITDLISPTGGLGGDQAGLLLADPAKLAAACQTVTGAIVADDAANTVTFHLAQSWGPFLATLANSWGSISDKKWVGANGGWDGDCQTWQKFYHPVTSIDEWDATKQFKTGSGENGTGPYMLDHWTPNQEVVLKAFDSYWRTSPAWPGGPAGAPQLKTIVIKTSPAPFANRVEFFRQGDGDLITEDSPSDLTQLDALVGETCDTSGACIPAANPANPARVYVGLPAVVRSDAFFNFNIDNTDGNEFIGSGQLDGHGVPPDFFNDLHVRRAFNYCFDWAAYIRDALRNEGVQSADVMLPGQIGYSVRDPQYTYDAAKCAAEFQASSLKSTDGQSLWDTGFQLSLVYSVGNSLRQVFSQILSKNISAINPKFVVKSVGLPLETFKTALFGGKIPLPVSGWLEDIHDPHDWLVPWITGVYAQRQSLPSDIEQQLSVLMNQGAGETDPARRATIYAQFNQAYYAAAPAILLAVPFNHHYEQRWVQGYFYNPIYSGYYFYALSKQ